MKDQILQLLRSEEGYLSGQEMSTRLGISRAAVWKAVEALRKEGYAIDSAPNRGYRLAAPTDRLSAREITARLSGHPWAGLVQVLDTVDSTNNLAKALAVQAPRRARFWWPTVKQAAGEGWAGAFPPRRGWGYTCPSFCGRKPPLRP